ncbi:hypothetical protein SCHPADRAFT_331709 [Schizopora paradoxa]|uniref:Uncharacterized protein n=1 Tax=Schizopora paradoxa TaxID=27342 RepID=A0A0H2RXA0_9AGAM|nr:hypothetical protein SCHPADRAFT_331709 [Schizopora paradoxa]
MAKRKAQLPRWRLGNTPTARLKGVYFYSDLVHGIRAHHASRVQPQPPRKGEPEYVLSFRFSVLGFEVFGIRHPVSSFRKHTFIYMYAGVRTRDLPSWPSFRSLWRCVYAFSRIAPLRGLAVLPVSLSKRVHWITCGIGGNRDSLSLISRALARSGVHLRVIGRAVYSIHSSAPYWDAPYSILCYASARCYNSTAAPHIEMAINITA